MNKFNKFNDFFDNIDFEKSLIFIPENRVLNDKYKDTINKLPTPLSHPRNLSNAGEKSLSPFRPL